MTAKQKAYQTSLIKQVHVSKRYQNYYKENKEEYVALLETHFGASSSKKLSVSDLVLLVDYLNFKCDVLPEKEKSGQITQKQQAYIEALWKEKARDKSEKALLGFVKRQMKKETGGLDELKSEEAQKLIIALKSMLE